MTINFPTNTTYTAASLPLIFNVSLDKNGTDRFSQYGPNAYRHLRTCNIGFMDGHVNDTADAVQDLNSGDMNTCVP